MLKMKRNDFMSDFNSIYCPVAAIKMQLINMQPASNFRSIEADQCMFTSIEAPGNDTRLVQNNHTYTSTRVRLLSVHVVEVGIPG